MNERIFDPDTTVKTQRSTGLKLFDAQGEKMG
jgi:hypothetical protein